MHKITKKLKEAFNNIISTMIFIPVVVLFSRKTKYPKERILSDCIIMGNGPSLLKDLEKIDISSSDFDKICVNFFAESDLYSKIKPKIYVIYDPNFWESETGDIFNKIDELFKKVIKETTWEIFLFAPFNFRKSKFYSPLLNNNCIKLVFFNAISIDGFPGFIRYCLSHRLGMPRAPNVIIPSLVFAINLGYKKIYLTGVDHSWHQEIVVKSDSKVYVAQKHFSDNLAIHKPMYTKSGGRDPATMHQLFLGWSNLFKGYELINDLAVRKDVKIFNLTEASFIDAFQKI
ncbi:MAG: DUF115 domain-containing protein [Bacteroidia bacterium]|nr:DUF115 domain-containing protein [Bacteroidia bacterium]